MVNWHFSTCYPPEELKLARFHELANVKKLAEGLNAIFIVRPFFEGYTRHFRQTSISFCEVIQTLTTGVHESSWNSCEKHERKGRVENACEFVYARKLVKARQPRMTFNSWGGAGRSEFWDISGMKPICGGLNFYPKKLFIRIINI